MYYIEEIKPRIFCVTFLDHYQLCMTFARFSEAYEGGHPKFLDNPFTPEEFHEWESTQGDNLTFEYPDLWGGFNLHAPKVRETIKRGLPGLNKWDQVFLTILSLCTSEYEDGNFAIIGVSLWSLRNDEAIVNHELAHGLYSTNKKYKKKVDRIFNKIPGEKKDLILQVLAASDYRNNVWIDETQAYLGTGYRTDDHQFEIIDQMVGLEKEARQFKEIFEEFDEDFEIRLIHPHIR